MGAIKIEGDPRKMTQQEFRELVLNKMQQEALESEKEPDAVFDVTCDQCNKQLKVRVTWEQVRKAWRQLKNERKKLGLPT